MSNPTHHTSGAAESVPTPVLYDPDAVLEVFHSARAGSDKPVGYLRGILAVIANWESRPEPQRWMLPAPADSVLEDATHPIAVLVAELRKHRFCGDCYPENGWPGVNDALARYELWKRAARKQGGSHD